MQIKHPQLTILSIRSDEGLMLGTSALETVYHGQFTKSPQLIKPITPPPPPPQSVRRNVIHQVTAFYSPKISRYHNRRHWSQVFYDVQRE